MQTYRVVASVAQFGAGDVLAIDEAQYAARRFLVYVIRRRRASPALIVKAQEALEFSFGEVVGLEALPLRLAGVLHVEASALDASRRLDSFLTTTIETLQSGAAGAGSSRKQGVATMSALGGKEFAGNFRDSMKKMRAAMDILTERMSKATTAHAVQIENGFALVKEVEADTAEMQAAFGSASNGGPQDGES